MSRHANNELDHLRNSRGRAASKTGGGKPPPAMRAVLVSSNALFREGLRSVLAAHRVRVIASYGSLKDLARIDSTHARSSILIDCETERDVVATAEELSRLPLASLTCQIVVLAGVDSPELVTLARLGAVNAIVRRDVSVEALIKLLAMVADDMTIMPSGLLARVGSVAAPALAADRAEAFPLPTEDISALRPGRPLSERELAILRCLVNGESNKAIARRLDIAEATVKIHVKGVLRKISVSNRTQAAIWALKHLAPTQPARVPPSSGGEWRDAVPSPAVIGAAESGFASRPGVPSLS